MNFHFVHVICLSTLHSTLGADHKTCLWDVGTGEVLAELELRDILFSVSFNFTGSKIVTACKDKVVRVHDARSLEILKVSLTV